MRNIGIKCLLICVMFSSLYSVKSDLELGFYEKSCPDAEKIIYDYVKKHIPNVPSLAAALLRMHFHDCFVRGCDASVLLSSTSNNKAEKSASPNQSLRGFDFLDRVKSLVEAECPGVVSIGVSHCQSFSNRLYNFTGKGDEDPSLDGVYAANLKEKKCRTPKDMTTIVEMDPGSFRTFDLGYYKHLLQRRGLFQSDAALMSNAATKSAIIQLLHNPLEVFFKEFALSMEKMGSIEVKTGSTGEIRKHCAVINS